MNIKPVILSGGSGSRLWPLSRTSFPKQFINFDGKNNLFHQTLKRSINFNNSKKCLIISRKQHGFLCRKEVKSLKAKASYILEETGRNTAPAVYFAALNSNPKDILCIMPSDHWISDNKKFFSLIKSSVNSAKEGNWVTFGIKPHEPSTAYGYIKVKNTQGKILDVDKFVEKPNKIKAKKFFKNVNYFWNSGIFIVSAEKCIESFKRFQPNFVQLANRCWENRIQINDEITLKKSFLEKIPTISLDYAIMEYEKKITLIPFSSNWSDLGNWDNLSKFISERRNNKNDNKKQILIDSKNTFIHSNDRIIAGVGISDLIVVDDDDATLIVEKNHVENVKNLLDELRKRKLTSEKEHSYEYRPWGKFENILDNDICKVKKLTINPKQFLSLQYHHKRSEHWVVVKGIATVNLNKKIIKMRPGDSIDIPIKAHHSLGNETNQDLIIIEIQMGTYFGEDDIVRISDPYNR